MAGTDRFIEIVIVGRNVSAVAKLLTEEAPRTCAAVWDELPITGDAYHAKWAGKELYTLVPPLKTDPGKENATITPIPGDVLYIPVPATSIDLPVELRRQSPGGWADLAVFYGRNSLLLGPDGFMPGNLFATIVDNLEEFAEACAWLFRHGTAGERLEFRRVE